MKRDGWNRRSRALAIYDLTLRRGVWALAVFFLLVFFLLSMVGLAHAQRGNVRYADQFPGQSVATKVTAAQSSCSPNIPCIIVIDANLSTMTEGTMPAACAQCLWKDYRSAGVERVTPAGSNGKPWVNVVTDCGAAGDGVTDDFAVAQACITGNPGKTIFFPMRAAASIGGGGATNYSYYLGDGPLTLSGNGSTLLGEHRSSWSGGVALKFAAGKGGVLIPANCFQCAVLKLEIKSLENKVGASVGIEVRGAYALVEENAVDGFGSHCIYLNGQGGLGYSTVRGMVRGNGAFNCGGDGVLSTGSDSAAVMVTNNVANGNGGDGFHDTATVPHTWMNNAASANTGSGYHSQNAKGSTWIGNYAEGDNGVADTYAGVATGDFVQGGWPGKGCTFNALALVDGGRGCNSPIGAYTRNRLDLWLQIDAPGVDNYQIVRCGKTADQDCEVTYSTYNLTHKWGWRRKASDNTWKLWNYTTGAAAVSVDPATSEQTWAPVAFANLGTPADGTFIYCNDCTIANPCAAGGNGAFAKRLNGAWVCN